MIKKIAAVFIAALMLACMFSACSGEEEAGGICGTWRLQGDAETECIYVINADGTGYVETNGEKHDLTWETNKNSYTFYIDATDTTESGTYTVNSAFLVLIHDGTHDYFRRVEE